MTQPSSADRKGIGRRALLASAIAGTSIAATAVGARAEFISAPDVVVFCDPTLSEAFQALARDYRARTKVPVRVRSAASAQLISLIERGTRTDVLATLASQLDRAAGRGLLSSDARSAIWRDPIVLAGSGIPARNSVPPAEALDALLGGKPLAVVDPTAPASLDGPALVARLGWPGVKLAGGIDGPEVAFLIESGAARLGLMEATDLATHDGLSVVAALPASEFPPRAYQAAIVKNVLSRNTVAFMNYLKTDPAVTLLGRAGLEVPA